MHKSYYVNNKSYSKFLNQGDIKNFEVYTDAIKKYLPKHGKVLDVGCGPGTVVNYLSKLGLDATGIEISKSSLSIAAKRLGKYKYYDGTNIPYPDNSFNVVGSIDVLEHVEDVSGFLHESLRVLTVGGRLIIATPNFMSLTNSYHYRTSGSLAKLRNALLFIVKLIRYLLGLDVSFDKMTPVDRPDFHPDDDATNLTNPLDILVWGLHNNLKLEFFVGSFMPRKFLSYKVGLIPVINMFTGGVFVVFKK